MSVPEITKEEYLKAISDGIEAAMPYQSDILAAIRGAVYDAIDENMLNANSMGRAIMEGITQAMPHEDFIAHAIQTGTRDALKRDVA